MAEDCLFAGVYAPLNATEHSNLPIMMFVSGGGFTSLSNGNFNGTGLVEASGMNMIVVRFNYRVGILGFISGTVVESDANDASSNNGLNDMIACARWLQQHATKFGGNPHHIVIAGDSAGGHAVDVLLQANNGTGFPDLFVGAIAGSPSWGSEPQVVGRDFDFQNNVNTTGCLNATNPIDCMRALPIAEFQRRIARNGWGPTLDGGKFLANPHYQSMEFGRFQKIPVIYGSTSNEGTPSFLSNHSAAEDADIERRIRNRFRTINDAEVQAMLTAYPASLNNISFFGRDVSSKNDTARLGKGIQWQRDAGLMSELAIQCLATFFSDMHAAQGNSANYHYRYNILDTTPGGLAEQGLFTPHTNELYAVWGPGNTDGNDPKCLRLATAEGGCATGKDIVQAYWISFVRTLDPNTYRLPGTPEWETWSIASPRRIVLDNGEAFMETMGEAVGEVNVAGLNQRQRCISLTLQFVKGVNRGVGTGDILLPFANGTAVDPTLEFGKAIESLPPI